MKKLMQIKFVRIGVIVMAIIIGAFGLYALAKFITEDFTSFFINSKDFYFTSNRLKKNGALYQVNNWSGVGAFNISFDLLSQKNTLLYNDYDIPYTITYTCPNDVTCNANKNSGTIYSASITHSDTVTLTVTPNRSFAENETLAIHIEATSSSPYIETIEADFEYIVGKQGITYEIEDEANQAYAMFKITNAINYCTVVTAFGDYQVGANIDNNVYRTLTNENKAKCIGKVITLDFSPNTLLIDTTNSLVRNSTYTTTTINSVPYVNHIVFNIEPMSTVAIKFYKKNPVNNYTYPITNPTSVVTVTAADPI